MARLLVKDIDYTHPDPVKDRQGAYKKDDIVVVMPDDHVWGGAEGPPKFRHVDLPGVDPKDIAWARNEERQTLDEITSTALRKNKKLLRHVSRVKERETKTRRRYKVVNDQIIDKTRG